LLCVAGVHRRVYVALGEVGMERVEETLSQRAHANG
jgi:hypothetical protein